MNDAWLGKLFVRFRERRDGRALAAVFDATARELIGVAAHMAPTLDQAEDVVQTTFVRAIEHAERYDPSQSLKGWLYGILWREAAKLRRSEGRRIEAAEGLTGAAGEPGDFASQRELDEAVSHALARVPSPYREVLEPVLREERSSREVAAALARSPGTVRVQLQRGLERLRLELGAARRRPGGSRLSALFASGLPVLRGELLAHAGFAPSAVPPASTLFLASQWAQASLTPSLLAASAVLVAGVGFGVSELRSEIDSVVPPAAVALSESPDTPAADAESTLSLPEGVARPSSAPRTAARTSAPRSARRAVRPEDVQVAGLVRDSAERELAGVRVVAEGENHYGYESTTTDEQGRFAFSGLSAGRWYVYADDERYARTWWQTHGVGIEEDDGQEFEAELELVLYPPQRVAGTVVDEAGGAVAAVQVTLAAEWPAGRDRQLQPDLTAAVDVAETDAEGRFVLERLLPGRMTVVLDHPEFARTLTRFDVPGAPRLVILRGMTLEGEVLLDGAPLAEVRLEAHSTRQSHLTMGDWDVRTDSLGRFRIEHVSPVGDSRLSGISTLGVWVEDERWTSDRVRVFESARATLPWVTLAARANDGREAGAIDVGRDHAGEAAARGEPFGTARIEVRLEDDVEEGVLVRLHGKVEGFADFTRRVSVFPTEPATFEHLAAGTYVITPANTDARTRSAETIELLDGESRVVVLRAPDERSAGACTLAGTLRCAGAPARVDGVYCRRTRGGPSFQALAELADGGRYRITGLEPGHYELVAHAADALACSLEVEVGAGETLIDLELPPGRIEGRLVGVTFLPARDASDRRHVRVFPYGWYQESGNRGVFVEADAEGRFSVRHLPPGDYAVSVERAQQRIESRVVTITAGAPVETLELGVVREHGLVSGRVTNGPGTRLSLAFLRREPQGLRRTDYAEIDPSGEFRHELEPGRYAALVSDFDARAPFTWVPELAVAAGETTALELELPAARALTIRLDPGGAWAARKLWKLRMPSGEWLPYVFFVGSDAGGRFAPERAFQLPLGRYALEADFGDPVPRVHEFELVPGAGPQSVVVPRSPDPSPGDKR